MTANQEYSPPKELNNIKCCSNFIEMKILHLKTTLLFCFTLMLSRHMLIGQSYQQTIDSLQVLLIQSQDTVRVDLLNELSYNFRRIAPDSVLKYARQAKLLAKSLAYHKGEAIAHKNLGIGNYKKLNVPPDTIIYHYQKAIKLAELANDYYTQAACYNNIALTHRYNENIYLAVQNYHKGINIYEQQGRKEDYLQALMFGNISVCYADLQDTLKAQFYCEKTIKIARDQNLNTILAQYLLYYGRLLYKIKKKEEGIAAILESLKVAKGLGDLESQVHNNLQLAEILDAEGRSEDAMQAANEALQVCVDQQFIHLKALPLFTLSKIYHHQGKFPLSLKYGEQALEHMKINQNAPILIGLTKHLQEIHASMNHFQKAYQFGVQYNLLVDSLRNADIAAKSADIETKYQLKDKEREIEFLNHKQEIQQNRERMLYVYLAFSTLLISVILFLLQKKTQLSQTISKQHQDITDKNKKLERYIESNLQLENFAFIASHDLKTPLRNIVSFTQLLERDCKNLFSQKQKEYLSFIIDGTRDLSHIIDDLLNYSRVQNQSLSPQKVNTLAIIKGCVRELTIFNSEKAVDIDIEKDQLPTSFIADPIKVKQLFLNLLINASKFHRPNTAPKIVISASQSHEDIQFSIQDNGIGIANEYHEKIFLIFKRLHSRKTYDGSGIGLAICKKIVEQHGGRIWVKSKEGHGSTFYFTIPKNLVVANQFQHPDQTAKLAYT